MKKLLWTCALSLVFAAGGTPAGAKDLPVFSLAWSEYPSWSTFGVAHEAGLLHGEKGKTGPLEEKWGVDLELKEADYDSCLVMYAAGQCDAACITNMDGLSPSLTRPTVGILPTSTSFGADALIVPTGITDVKQLKGKKVHGLAKSVSEYCFVRNLEILGEKEKDYQFSNMDPGAAALAMQQKQKDYDAIVVWNPFVLETLNKRSDARVLFDSTKIPDEIIDMVLMSQSSLDRPGGPEAAAAIIEVFYAVNQRLADAKTGDQTLIALGEKFSHLDLAAMKTVVKQTRFYATPEEGVKILTDPATREIMKKVVDFCLRHEIVSKAPVVAYGDAKKAGKADFRFDPSYLRKYQEKNPGKADGAGEKEKAKTPAKTGK